MLGDSSVLGGGGGGSSGGAAQGGSADAVAAVASGGGGDGAAAAAGGGGGSNLGDEERGRMLLEEGERSGSFGGNRWPRQETLALLRIRSDMDVAFRDASVKGPLWEDISRKMAELGYQRSAKKCKEKFENVYKYHKRTKEGRSGKADGKTYRFFDQLEAFENHPSTTTITHQSPKPPPPPQQQHSLLPPPSSQVQTTTAMAMPPHVTVPSTTTTTAPMAMHQGITITTAPSINLTTPSYPPPPPPPTTTTKNPTSLFPHSTPNPTTTTTNPLPPHTTIPISFNIPTDLLSNSSSSSTSSDETLEGSRKRKRKWKDFFERLMKEVVEKQEQLQKRFLEAIERREQDRMAREEAWRVQEMQRIHREREILAQERSIAASKDAAVMSFLQKIAEQQNLGQAFNTISIVQTQPQPQPISVPQAPLSVQQTVTPNVQPLVPPVTLAPQPRQQQQQQQVTGMEIVKVDNNNGENMMSPSSSRWPKVEVQALIQLRTSLDAKYQENGPKGPLWEEISSSMRKLGYNRSAKRCKEKWENINKYFKKVKESNKKRPEDSKTCPYFHQLDSLYREKNKLEGVTAAKPESMVAPLMVRPEQQWPPQPGPPPDVAMEDAENDPMDRHHQHDEEDTDDDDDGEKDIGDEEDDEEESGGGGNNYEIVASKPASASSMAPE